jgi:hypothetical protein
MPTNTYVALDKATVTTATPSITFTNINQGYTDLVIIANTKNSSVSVNSLELRFNGDSATNYSLTFFYGDGTSAVSSRLSNRNQGIIGWDSTTEFTPSIVNIQNYSNATTFKTVLCRSSDATGRVAAWVNLWRKTPEAITSITINSQSPANIAVGSTFSLYGIAASSVGAKATGGAIYSDADYYYHAFAGNGTFTPTQSLTADVLVVAGGGGAGGSFSGGAGGAGGLLGFTSQSLTTTNYTITVGAGGSAVTSGNAGNTGNDSQFASLTLVKGGGGGGGNNAGANNGKTGGSGGGSTSTSSPPGSAGAATSGQGFAGGVGSTDDATYRNGGGGGGAGAVGGNAGASGTQTTAVGGVGSSAFSSWGAATGTGQNVAGTYYYAGGGAGGNSAAGLGGGGLPNTSGAANTGGGAGTGQAGNTNPQPQGGSGIVIIRYAK